MWASSGGPEAASASAEEIRGGECLQGLQGNLGPFPPPAQPRLPGSKRIAPHCGVTTRQRAFWEGNPSSGPRCRVRIQAACCCHPRMALRRGGHPNRRGSPSTSRWQLWEPGAGLAPAQQRLSVLLQGYPPSWGGEGWLASASCPLVLRCRNHSLTLASPLGRGEQLSVPATRCHDGKTTHPGRKLKYALEIHVKKEKSLQV